MEWIAIVVGILFVLIGLLCIFSVVIGLPGTWLMIFFAVVIEFCDRWYLPHGAQQTFNLWLLLGCLALAGVGEVLEFFAGVLGAKKGGSSKRGMVGSLIGGIVGAILGTGIPIPIIGSLIGALLGTFAGALIGEMSHEGKQWGETIRPATGATIGRVLGTLAKMPIAVAVWVMLSIAVFM